MIKRPEEKIKLEEKEEKRQDKLNIIIEENVEEEEIDLKVPEIGDIDNKEILEENTKVEEISPPPEERNLVVRILGNYEDYKLSFETWEKRKLESLEKRINKVVHYYGKMVKKMASKDPEFGENFLGPMEINNDSWLKMPTREKIHTLLEPFEKVLIITRYHGVLKEFDESVNKKLLKLVKKYLKILNTHSILFPEETEEWYEDNELREFKLQEFKDDILEFAFERIRKDEEEKYKVTKIVKKHSIFFYIIYLKKLNTEL